MRKFYSTLRILSAVTLFFFCWTYMPIWQIAAYAAEIKKLSAVSSQQSTSSSKADSRPQTADSSQRFEKALEEIREKVGKAEEKTGRGGAATEEIEAIRTRKAEIESLDGELRKEFAATEKKLKDANLPQEILGRHYKFVKHYDDNLRELKANLDGLEKAQKAQDKVKAGEYLKKAKIHLEKTKPPKKHVPLDPNKLPFRSVKAKERAPRLKKEEFERDFGLQKQKKLATDEHGLTLIQNIAGIYSEVRTLNSNLKSTPILLAYNDIASDAPFQLPRPSAGNLPLPFVGEGWGEGALSLNSEHGTLNLAAASAADLPTADDLAQTPEVQFTDDIQNLAAQLNHSPVKIYEWVRNNIEFVPTYGSIQGADMCLQSRQCNALDTASLLAALLRTSNLPARYVYGTIEVPVDKVMNWVGGFTDPMAATILIASGGIRGRLINSGAKPEKIQMEHVWVEAYIPYGNYRGAIMDDSIKTWIPMDGSFKQYTYTDGFDITSTLPFSQDDYLSQVQSQNAVHYYQSKIQEYLDVNMPEKSIIDVKGYREIIQETYHFLPSTLPFINVAQLSMFSTIPDRMKAKMTFTISNPGTGSSASYTIATAEIAGKRITMSCNPATANDGALINNYDGYIYGVPAYMLNLIPVLRIQGDIKLSGEAVVMGSEQSFTIQINQPAANLNETVQKRIITGTYYAVGLDFQGMNETVVGKRNNSLTANVLSESAGTLGKDEFIGEYLYVRALTYFYANDKIYKSGAKLFNTTITRTISESITSFPLSVTQFFGITKSVSPSGIEIDVAMDRIIAVSRNGDTNKERTCMDMAGLVSSYHEHSLFEDIDGYASVSAVRALQVASVNNITIQRINTSNIDQVLSILNVAPEIKADIQNAINAGKEVIVPQTNLQINDWQGVGYIVKDILTGSGSYIISGGLHGGSSTSSEVGQKVSQAFVSVLTWVRDTLSAALGPSIAWAATLSSGELLIGKEITYVGTLMEEMGYYDIQQCNGLVRQAYWHAGICLDEWSPWVDAGAKEKQGLCGKNGQHLTKKFGIVGFDKENGVSILFRLVAAMKDLFGGVRWSEPNIGDMIFWHNTWDFNGDCTPNDPLTHVGIVKQVNFDANGTLYFIHASSTRGVVTEGQKMNIKSGYSGSEYNTQLRVSWKKCVKCSEDEIKNNECSATAQCLENYKPHRCSDQAEYDSKGTRANDLFAGYGTVRNPK